LDLPVPDVTIERLATPACPEADSPDAGESQEEDDISRRKEELEYLEAQEAALRLLDLARGYRISESKDPELVNDALFTESEVSSPKRPSGDACLRSSEHLRKRYTEDLRAEIGHYALIHGVGSACRVYSERTGKTLPRTSVRDMMIKYQSKHGLSNLPPLHPVDVKIHST
jgi:hypothetical protein